MAFSIRLGGTLTSGGVGWGQRENFSMTSPDGVCSRYLALYTGAIADILDKRGLRQQVLPRGIAARTGVKRLAGLAFTGLGAPTTSATDDDTETRLRMLDSIRPGTISVWSCGGSVDCAHWGEMMSNAARQRGCEGAVVDGGVRDLDFIGAMEYPVFASFACAASSVGRWNIQAYQVPIRIGETEIAPNDFVFGDVDGVVIVPQALTLEVLTAAESICERERGMREELRRGVSVQEAFAKYGSL
jgi:regulator of RNase E activity RraA